MAARINTSIDEGHRDKIRASQLVNLLSDVALGKQPNVSEKRIQSAKAVLPFIRPALSSVEQTITDERDKLDEGTLLAELQGLFTAKPDLLDKLIQLRDSARLIQEGERAIDSARDRVEIPSSSTLSSTATLSK